MKNTLLKTGSLLVLSLACLIGCGGQNKEDLKATIEAEAKTAFSLVSVTYNAYSSSEGISICGGALNMECETPNGFSFSYTYTLTPFSDEYELEYIKMNSEGDYLDVIVPEIWELPSGEQGYAAYTLSGECTFTGATEEYASYVGQKFGKKDWKIKVNSMETRPVIEKIADMKRSHSSGDTVITRGYISGYYSQDGNHFYTGVFLSDGEDTVMLYAGSLSNYVGLIDIGSLVQVSATFEPYNGLIEVKPVSSGIKVIKAAEGVNEPAIFSLTASEFKTVKSIKSGNITKVEGLKLSTSRAEIEKLKAGEHWTIEATSSGVTFPIYVNYHVTSPVQEEIKQLLLENYDKTFDFTGILSWYNNPQLSPAITFATETAVSCFDFAE